MKIINVIRFFLLVVLLNTAVPELSAQEKSSVCFTFDDGNPKDVLNYSYQKWNEMILDHLKKNNLQAVLYACGKNLNNPEGTEVLKSWDKSGHIIANHTYSHWNYNSKKISYKEYRDDILRCDSLIKGYENYQRYFRAPFLKSGETREKRDSLNAFLTETKYKNGYVTIDASDWFVNSRLIKFMEQNPGGSIEVYKNYYIEHLLERARFYYELAVQLLGRKIKHSILLHHNLAAALFLGDLIKAFEKEGWDLIDASDALTDEVYAKIPDIVPAGESLIWGLAKESGKYENILRVPGEDSIYEEKKMNDLGL